LATAHNTPNMPFVSAALDKQHIWAEPLCKIPARAHPPPKKKKQDGKQE